MAHPHGVYDTDTHYIIDGISREVRNLNEVKNTIMQYDHNSERLTFELPRVVDGHDLTLCNAVRVRFINISSDTRETHSDIYEVDDLKVSDTDENTVVFTWLISGAATQFVGPVNFNVCFLCIGEDNKIEYAWNTAVCNNISVGNGINTDEIFKQDYTDIVAKWEAEMTAEVAEGVQKNIAEWEDAATENVRAEMAAFGEQWNATLDVERVRIDELAAMRTSDGNTEYFFDDDTVNVTITTNGIIAKIECTIGGVDLDEYGFFVSKIIPKSLAPFETVYLSNEIVGYVDVSISNTDDDCARLEISNVGEKQHIAGLWSSTYKLAYPIIPEVTDARVGLDGQGKPKTYDSAGDAVRAAQQMGVDNAERMNDFDTDMADVFGEIANLKKNGTGGKGYTVHEIEGYDFVLGDQDGRIAVAVRVGENGKTVVDFVGKDELSAAKALKQNGNYDAEINMFICYGQSWATGYDADAITTTPRYDNLMLDTGIMTDPLSNLSAVATSFLPAVEKTQTADWKKGETPVTAQMNVVKQLMESEDGLTISDLSYQLLGTAPGYGGMSLAQLKKGTDYYTRLINQVQQANDIATAMGKRLVVQAFSWVQGSIGDYPKDENGRRPTYAEALEQLRLDIDTDVKAITGQTQDVKCITWQSFIYNSSLRAKQVYDQYVGAAETYPNIICSGATYHLDNVTAANLHFTSESQDWLGAYFGVAYKRSIIDCEKFEPLKPTKASHSGKILYVKFNVPQRPLVFDTERLTEAPNKGFKLYAAGGTEKTITEVAIISPDTVKIVCADDVLSTDRLTYGDITASAYQWVSDNHGNLRDSQGDYIQYVTDPYEYYGSVNGDGKPPYGYIPVPSQVLPVHNWCVIFDKTISELEG